MDFLTQTIGKMFKLHIKHTFLHRKYLWLSYPVSTLYFRQFVVKSMIMIFNDLLQ